MCGIIGIIGKERAIDKIYPALLALQHRGQDAAGAATFDNAFHLERGNGLVSSLFNSKNIERLKGNLGIGHVRYPTVGSGGIVVMDEETCMVDVAKYFLTFLQDESCGKCIPCRLGIDRMLEIITDITEGRGKHEQIDLLEDLASTVSETALCALGKTAANPVLSTLRYFREEYDAHINRQKCPAGVCQALVAYRRSWLV